MLFVSSSRIFVNIFEDFGHAGLVVRGFFESRARAENFKVLYRHCGFENGVRWLGLCGLDSLLVKTSHAYQGKSIAYKHSFDLLVKNTRAGKRREAVDFEHPGLHSLVPHYVEAKNLKTALLAVSNFVHFFHYLGFYRN